MLTLIKRMQNILKGLKIKIFDFKILRKSFD